MKEIGEKGESLVEVIIAVAVISISLLSLLQLVYVNFVAANNARNKGYAAYLSQEAADMVTNTRDTTVKRLSNGDTSKYDPTALLGDPAAPLTRWYQYIYRCWSPQKLETCSVNGYYAFRDYQPHAGWWIDGGGGGVGVGVLPCYNCPVGQNPPIYPTAQENRLADDNSGTWTSADPRYRKRDLGGTRGILYNETAFYRYIYIEKFDVDPTDGIPADPKILHVRIIVSWKQKDDVMSVGQDLLLTDLGVST
jgi:type II secretory pathway pseudopilin PulG